MAKIYADQGETKTAMRILEKVLASRPKDERALRLSQELQ